ncbi:hypothetical protein Aduo_012744 [Ancylostoma duodenale]
MGPPVTRSRAHSAEAWVAGTHSTAAPPTNAPVEDTPTDAPNPSKMVAPLTSALTGLDDSSVVHGCDAKHLRDAASEALTNVWYDTHYTTSQLVQKFNDSNAALLQGLNNTFEAVDSRINSILTVALCSPEGGHSPRITPFSGDGESSQFSIWLRRLEDILRMRAIAPTSEQKASFLVGYLDGVAREKIEELSLDERKDFDRIVAHLKNYFEGPQQRNMARQLLSSCRQEIGESAPIFANRLLNLVRAATSGQAT